MLLYFVLMVSTVLCSPVRRLWKELPPLVDYPSLSQRILLDGEIPDYVIDHSPYVHLYSEEKYLPYDIELFVRNFHLEYRNGSLINGGRTLEIRDLAQFGLFLNSSEIFMTLNSDFDKDPEWITGRKNRPKFANGEIVNAPATLIVVDKGNGWVDAFWFYFYSFNLGPFVMGTGPYGNHVGDWEHSLVRFYKGKPQLLWMSLHGGGNAYLYEHVEKLHGRPVIFSARGTHANYASVGQHAHDLPLSILSDFTDRGPLWDPVQNYLAYTFHNENLALSNGSHLGREARLGKWLSFLGHWGDNQLIPEDPRQSWSPWEWRYLEGPTGPLTKNLLRISPCQRAKWWNFKQICNVRNFIKMGEGVESEGNNSCGHLFAKIKPQWLRWGLEKITSGGLICWWLDLLYG